MKRNFLQVVTNPYFTRVTAEKKPGQNLVLKFHMRAIVEGQEPEMLRLKLRLADRLAGYHQKQIVSALCTFDKGEFHPLTVEFMRTNDLGNRASRHFAFSFLLNQGLLETSYQDLEDAVFDEDNNEFTKDTTPSDARLVMA